MTIILIVLLNYEFRLTNIEWWSEEPSRSAVVFWSSF